MTIDWTAKLRHLLQTLAFCLAIGTIQYAFAPHKPYAPPVVFSLFIGVIIWAVVDLGRHLLPSARETGWPAGWPGVALVATGIAAGWVFGNELGDLVCRALGLYPTDVAVHGEDHLRSGVLITVLAGLVGSYWFYSRNKSAWLERKMSEAQRHATEARLRLLEAQLEPHMLFNTLANLRVLIGSDPRRAQGMLDHMIDYLRATLAASRSTTHGVEAEFDRLRDYLELMAIRMGPRLRYSLQLPPELAAVPVPALVLQPLVENSVRHGLEPKVDGGRVDVSARREDGLLVLQVVDTGIGAAAASAGDGFGLQQVRDRLATLYGPAARLDFAATADGATASLRIPIQP